MVKMTEIIFCVIIVIEQMLAVLGLIQWRRDGFDEIDDFEEWAAACGAKT